MNIDLDKWDTELILTSLNAGVRAITNAPGNHDSVRKENLERMERLRQSILRGASELDLATLHETMIYAKRDVDGIQGISYEERREKLRKIDAVLAMISAATRE